MVARSHRKDRLKLSLSHKWVPAVAYLGTEPIHADFMILTEPWAGHNPGTTARASN